MKCCVAGCWQTLGDKDKRSDYDNFGRTSATQGQGQQWGGGGFQQGGFGPFESFFGGSFGGFNFGGFNFGADSDSGVEKYIITYRYYLLKWLS